MLWQIARLGPSRSGTHWPSGDCKAITERRIPQDRRDDLIDFALEHEALTTRELAVKYTDEKRSLSDANIACRLTVGAGIISAQSIS